jgi:hypothetical protein
MIELQMRIRPIKSTLTTLQKKCLDTFLTEFLPARGNKRKNSGNELDYIQTSLTRVFSKWFSFTISRHDLLDAFERIGYSLFTKKGDWNAEVKNFKPSAKGEEIRFNDGYIGNDAMFIYVDIEAPVVRQLLLTTMSLPISTKPEKRKPVEDLIKRIIQFQEKLLPDPKPNQS